MYKVHIRNLINWPGIIIIIIIIIVIIIIIHTWLHQEHAPSFAVDYINSILLAISGMNIPHF